MWRASTQRRGHTVADLMKYDHTSPRRRRCRAEPVGMARWHHVFASPVNNEAGLIRKQSEMTQTLMSLLWSCSCNQMLIQFYVCLSFVSFLLGFGFHRQCDSAFVWKRQKYTKTRKLQAARGHSNYFRLWQRLSSPLFPILFSPFPPPLPVSYSSFFSTLQRLATIKLKKETRQHAEVPRSAGIINKSAEEEVNCCNQLIQPTAADGERF